MIRRLLTALAAVLVMTAPFTGAAQMSRQPFSFGYSGVGMSPAYREAMLRHELFGFKPDQISRDRFGRLVTVDERDGVAVAAYPDGTLIVGWRGREAALGTLGLGPLLGEAAAIGYATCCDGFVANRTSAVIDEWIGMLE